MKPPAKPRRKATPVATFLPCRVIEPAITEGRTYLARVVKDPWKGHAGHRSILGRLVKVRAYQAVNVEWPGGGGNSFSRDSVQVIGEVKS